MQRRYDTHFSFVSEDGFNDSKNAQAMAVHSKMSLRRCAATVALGAGAMSVGFVAPQALEDRRGIHMHNVGQITKIIVILKDLMEIRSSTLSRSSISIPMTSISIAAISTKRHSHYQ